METLQDLVKSLEKRDSATVLSWKEGEETKTKSFGELYNQITDYGKGLLELGLKPGDRVAVFSRNIPEWIGLSLGINNAGLVDVPRGEESDADEISYILEHSEAKAVIVEDRALLEKVRKNKHDSLEHIVSIRGIEGITNIDEIEERGKNSRRGIDNVDRDCTASIIYTSGTTGIPKGVELSHGNFTSNITSVLERIPLGEDDKAISILPAWHAFERMVKYIALASGTETFHSTQKKLMQDLEEQQPTIMASVPRIWEMVYKGLIKKIREESGIKRKLAEFAIEASSVRMLRIIPYLFFHRKLQKKLGGRFRFAMSGGGALPKYIDDFFDAAGIEIPEGYGLTETGPVVSVRIPGKKAQGTVGPPLKGVETKIIDYERGGEVEIGHDGVVYVRGPNVMKGYYRNFEETNKVLHSDGWFDTGDLGCFDKAGNLKIIGRAKDDMIVPSSGENVYVIPLASSMKRSDYIAEVIVVGQGRKNICALVEPDVENLKEYCKTKEISCTEDKPCLICDNADVQKLYREEIDKFVSRKAGFKANEIIKDFRIVPKLVVMPTLKPIRAKNEQLYRAEIERMYE